MSSEPIEFLSAILIFSNNPEHLADFYRRVLGIPLEEEKHGAGPVHYGCELGDIHFAIHPSADRLADTPHEERFRLAFTVFSTAALVERLERNGVPLLYPPKESSFAVFSAVRDPDGNHIEFTELRDPWFAHLKSRKASGADVVARWEQNRGTHS